MSVEARPIPIQPIPQIDTLAHWQPRSRGPGFFSRVSSPSPISRKRSFFFPISGSVIAFFVTLKRIFSLARVRATLFTPPRPYPPTADYDAVFPLCWHTAPLSTFTFISARALVLDLPLPVSPDVFLLPHSRCAAGPHLLSHSFELFRGP